MILFRKCLPIIVRQMSCKKPPPKNRFLNGIQQAFTKHLFLTNTMTTGVLMFVGDIIQQEMEYRQHKLLKRYDYVRSSRMFTTGLILGPIQHFFYEWLGRYLPETDMKTIIKKIIMDQLIMSPVGISVFFYSMCVMELKSFIMCLEELSDKFLEVYMVDWLIGPITQVINFHYVPQRYQVLGINAMTMFYNIYLSYVKHNK